MTNNPLLPLMSIFFVPPTETTPVYILPTIDNVPRITYYCKNTRKEEGPPTAAPTQTHESDLAPVQGMSDLLGKNNDVVDDNKSEASVKDDNEADSDKIPEEKKIVDRTGEKPDIK